MKKSVILFISCVVLFAIYTTHVVFAQTPSTGTGTVVGEQARPSNRMPTKSMKSMSIEHTATYSGQQKEALLKKREASLQNTEKNSQEARAAFQQEMKQKQAEFEQKMKAAREQRKACMLERQTEIKALEQERTAKMKELQTSCTPKMVSTNLTKPEKPSLEGMSTTEAQAAREAYKNALLEYNQKVKEAMETCRAGIKEQQQAFREKMIELKEQCVSTERTVLGLSTEIPFNQE